MRWEDLKRSSNVEDRRGEGGTRFSGSNLSSVLPIAQFLMKSNIGRVVLLIGGIAYFFGFNPMGLLNKTTSKTSVVNSKQDAKLADFTSAVLGSTEDVWSAIFKSYKSSYVKPNLVLFRDSIKSGCGYASKQSGPFYCPTNQKIYLDLSFFNELRLRHNSPGDFAQAYVIAHEVGHHVQNLAGTLKKVHKKQNLVSKTEANALQVGVELQADCYAGVWAYYMQNQYGALENGDIQEALNAANAIGDDTLQKQAQGYAVPDSFTHGSSIQRVAWFKKGYHRNIAKYCQSI